ncbi:hypothetical protein SELMODRAFT_403857 [Selaginella moellendorffii]|uniref:Uncharacterized protein n=2 Tax=Selaginella moellendorffii TaxID=88036 RepID=D8QSS0_SELML|nr:hypothetical protein SELMODRAFT_403857 [Selaginella moellendorffii]
MAPDHTSPSSSSTYDPQSLQDLQRMRVDDLISWLSENKADGLPPRARPESSQQYEGVSPASLKDEKPQLPAKVSPRKPLKRPPLLWKTRRNKAKNGGVGSGGSFLLSSDLIERNAARFNSFDEEIERQKCSLENHYCTYDAIREEIVNDTRSMELWRGMMEEVQDSEPEFIERKFPDFPPSASNMEDLCEDEDEDDSPGCKFFSLRQSRHERGRLRMVTKTMRSLWCSCSPPRTADDLPKRRRPSSAPASTSGSPSPPPPSLELSRPARPNPLKRTRMFGPLAPGKRLTQHCLDKPFQLRPPVGRSRRKSSYQQSLRHTLRGPYHVLLLVFWICFFAFGALAWYLQYLEDRKNSSSWWK